MVLINSIVFPKIQDGDGQSAKLRASKTGVHKPIGEVMLATSIILSSLNTDGIFPPLAVCVMCKGQCKLRPLSHSLEVCV